MEMAAKKPVAAVFDIGKTNKKLFLFDEAYRIVWEETRRFEETVDDEGFPCEDLDAVSQWMLDRFQYFLHAAEFDLKAVNFSAYGASFVHLDEHGKLVAPLYNYLKSYPADLQEQFYDLYGGEERLSVETCSPPMGFLNTGLQLYWLKYRKPAVFERIHCSLPLPQYCSYLFTKKMYTEITYIGSHSAIWDFRQQTYHRWVQAEGLDSLFGPLHKGDETIRVEWQGRPIVVGTGLHDSSAAIIPYLVAFSGGFAIISTGTWCISLNPFNRELPDAGTLRKGGLSYLSYRGEPVKAAMLFAGNDHAQQVARIAAHFGVSPDFYEEVEWDPSLMENLEHFRHPTAALEQDFLGGTQPSAFGNRELSSFRSPAEAYYGLLSDIVAQQRISTGLTLADAPVSRIFVDGGFCRNAIYMQLLSRAFPEHEVLAASMAQATALGAALAIHDHWNTQPVPSALIELKNYRREQG